MPRIELLAGIYSEPPRNVGDVVVNLCVGVVAAPALAGSICLDDAGWRIQALAEISAL